MTDLTHDDVEIKQLEEELENELQKCDALKKLIDNDNRNLTMRQQTILNQQREVQFYEDKIKKMNNADKMKQLELEINEVLGLREKSKQLEKELEEFKGLEPTNEDLKRKIDELKKSRLSLDMTFDDSNSTLQSP